MSPTERAGQLIMVGLDADASVTSLDSLVRSRHLGGVILLGGWFDGAATVRAATRHLAGLASEQATVGLGLLLAVDQEGGSIRQLRGPGLLAAPSALEQGRLSGDELTAEATAWAKNLRGVGVNVNLAPVADTVPASLGRANEPIGRYARQFGSDPDANAKSVVAFVNGMHAGGVATAVKHFPGLGRVTGNTDFTSSGITDTTTTAADAYLRPFAAGIGAETDMVMVSSARYPRIDPDRQAMFSPAVVTDLLRVRLGYQGVVITDDVGAARSVSGIPVAQRALRFVEAGGDIVLSGAPATIPTMHAALTARMASDPAFARRVETSVARVVALKVRMRLAMCP